MTKRKCGPICTSVFSRLISFCVVDNGVQFRSRIRACCLFISGIKQHDASVDKTYFAGEDS